MKNTFHLVMKDFRLLRSQLLVGILLSVISGLSITLEMPTMTFVVIMLLLGYYSCVQGFYLEEKNDTMTLLGALPVRLNQIILGKYLLFFITALLALITLALLTLAGAVMQAVGRPLPFLPTAQSFAAGWVAIPIGFSIGAVFSAIMIPPIVKLGVMKSRWLLFALYFAGFAGIGALTSRMSDITSLQMQTLSRIAALFAPDQVLNYLTLMIASLLVLYLSYLLSCRIYAQKRERGR